MMLAEQVGLGTADLGKIEVLDLPLEKARYTYSGLLMTDNKIAALAEAYHTSIAPHSIASFLGVTASFHAAEAVPNFLIQVFTRVEGAKGTYRITTPDLMLKPAGKDTAVKDKNGVINIDIPVAIGGVAVLKRV